MKTTAICSTLRLIAALAALGLSPIYSAAQETAAAPAAEPEAAVAVEAPQAPLPPTAKPDTVEDAIAKRIESALARFEGKEYTYTYDSGVGNRSGGGSFLADLVPILGIVLSLGFPPIIVSIILFYRYKRMRMRYNTIITLAEKGVQVPALDLDLDKKDDSKDPLKDLRTGCILLAVGIGISLFFILAGGEEGAGFGAVPALIGVAYILIYFVGSRKKDANT